MQLRACHVYVIDFPWKKKTKVMESLLHAILKITFGESIGKKVKMS